MKVIFILFIFLLGCSADKTAGGAVLGAGWGAGAGAVIGNEITGSSADGAAVGAGFGLVEGAMTGAGLDVTENKLDKTDAEIEELKIKNLANSRQIADVQNKLDYPKQNVNLDSFYGIPFDIASYKVKPGSVKTLQFISNEVKKDGTVFKIKLIGHADDSGSEELNQKLSMNRAESVAKIITDSGVSRHMLELVPASYDLPRLSNSSPEGRLANRRVEIQIVRQ